MTKVGRDRQNHSEFLWVQLKDKEISQGEVRTGVRRAKPVSSSFLPCLTHFLESSYMGVFIEICWFTFKCYRLSKTTRRFRTSAASKFIVYKALING